MTAASLLSRRWRPAAAGIAGLVVVGAAIAAYLRDDQAADALRAIPAALLAIGVAGLALSLPGVRLRGAVLGGCFVTAGMFTWTFTQRPGVIWAVLGIQGILAAVWAWPWLAGLRALPRLGTAWVGLAYWVLGTLGALLVGHLGVAAQRVAYGGVFGLCALAIIAIVRRRDGGEDPSVGISAAILLGLAALLLAGSGTLFTTVHDVPGFAASDVMRGRFWGGPALYFHPNSMAGLAVIAAARIGPDRAFAAWQRLSVLLLAGFLLFETNSRVAFLFAGTAAVVHAIALLRRRHHPDLPRYRRVWLAMLLPFLVLGLVLGASGGQNFLVKSRFVHSDANDVTSGRLETWSQVGGDWLEAGWATRLLGDTRTSRAVVTRDDDPVGPDGQKPKLNTDNAAVGALRRGGLLGAAAFAFGLLLLLYNLGLRRLWARRSERAAGSRVPAPAWLLVAALGALPTIATEDWWLGGTNGGVWILLLAGEAYLLWAAASPRPASPGPTVAGWPAAAVTVPDTDSAETVDSTATVTPASEPSRR